ncbi:MAG TPA: VOC family protein [Acidimicrobiia bacterium]|nr:VOC family protein [Acidimicrobiia bacterium]
MTAPLLAGLDVSGTPDAWRAAGFAVDDDGGIRIGHVRMQTECGTKGIAGWSFAGLPHAGDIDGLATATCDGPPIEPGEHPNGATLIDHVVVFSGDAGRTTRALEAMGLDARRQRDAGTYGSPMRQTFFKTGDVIIELIGPVEPEPEPGPTGFYGIACSVKDLDACKALLGDALGNIKDAVQPGRRIVTLRHRDVGLRVATAFMSE